MFLIFNAQGQFIASSDSAPDSDDLSSRNEQAVETEQTFTNPILRDGQIIEGEAYAHLNLEEQRKLVAEQINALRDKKTAGGVYLPAVKHWFDTDSDAQVNILGAYNAMKMLNLSERTWRTFDNQEVKLSFAEFEQLYLAVVNVKDQNHFNAVAHKKAVEKSDSPLSYDYSSGWTETFEEHFAKENAANAENAKNSANPTASTNPSAS